MCIWVWKWVLIFLEVGGGCFRPVTDLAVGGFCGEETSELFFNDMCYGTYRFSKDVKFANFYSWLGLSSLLAVWKFCELWRRYFLITKGELRLISTHMQEPMPRMRVVKRTLQIMKFKNMTLVK